MGGAGAPAPPQPEDDDMTLQFDEIIASRDGLRALVKAPSAKVSHKAIDHIDDLCARFIAASPFVIVATRGGDGRLDLSPKGDPPGFVAVLDAKTLAIPDRPATTGSTVSRT
jgi:uncharacterized protein